MRKTHFSIAVHVNIVTLSSAFAARWLRPPAVPQWKLPGPGIHPGRAAWWTGGVPGGRRVRPTSAFTTFSLQMQQFYIQHWQTENISTESKRGKKKKSTYSGLHLRNCWSCILQPSKVTAGCLAGKPRMKTEERAALTSRLITFWGRGS